MLPVPIVAVGAECGVEDVLPGRVVKELLDQNWPTMATVMTLDTPFGNHPRVDLDGDGVVGSRVGAGAVVVKDKDESHVSCVSLLLHLSM